ncbi:MAG: phenylalanine--tRNA ligase subunit beta [Thaumarchaeota archaeon]|nr:MAG: phenylalanine--tRNA ligase subunit beta [Nitrososphaerota archaeon]
MPVVALYFDRIEGILGKKISKEKIISTLPFIGLDIEEETKDHVNVEYSPNRPDYATDYGIVSSLQGLLGIKTGIPKLKIKKGKNSITVNPSVRKIRPFVTAIEARNGKLNDETIRQLIVMQEDLHNGIGRRRKKSSIGIHDLDKISFPLRYTTTGKDDKFIPLDSSKEMSIRDILERTTEAGIKYGYLLANFKKVPIILDSHGHKISLPPIINSERTKISNNTRNLLVEVTAMEKNAAEDTLAVITNVLQDAGFELFSIKISGANNSTPLLKPRNLILDSDLVNKILGIKISISTMVSALRKSRLDAQSKGQKIICTIPRYRTDIFGPMDLVEEVVLGYGIENLEPTIPKSISVGQKAKITTTLDAINSVMIGLGFSEVMNFGLMSQRVLCDYTKRDSSKIVSVSDSKSQEHTILRNAILPGLIDTLSKNIHESYPQKLFETGVVFLQRNGDISEEIHLACVSAHNDITFTEIKSVLQSFLKSISNFGCRTPTSTNPMFLVGSTADVFVFNDKIGEIGLISPEVRDNFKLRVPIAGFEIKLTVNI